MISTADTGIADLKDLPVELVEVSDQRVDVGRPAEARATQGKLELPHLVLIAGLREVLHHSGAVMALGDRWSGTPRNGRGGHSARG